MEFSHHYYDFLKTLPKGEKCTLQQYRAYVEALGLDFDKEGFIGA